MVKKLDMGESEREREGDERNDGVSTILSNERAERQTSEDNPVQIVALIAAISNGQYCPTRMIISLFLLYNCSQNLQNPAMIAQPLCMHIAKIRSFIFKRSTSKDSSANKGHHVVKYIQRSVRDTD
jgi:hypothetical protein